MLPMGTDVSNICPNGDFGPCEGTWYQPFLDIGKAYFRSAVPPDYPQDSSAEEQCGGSNSPDICWDYPTAQCVPYE